MVKKYKFSKKLRNFFSCGNIYEGEDNIAKSCG